MPDAATAAAAEAQIHDRVFAPAFFFKLAQAGIKPRNDAEAQSLLRFGKQAFALDAREAEKRASARGDAFAKAAALLDRDAGVADAADDRRVAALAKSAAASFLADPAIAAAAAALVPSA